MQDLVDTLPKIECFPPYTPYADPGTSEIQIDDIWIEAETETGSETIYQTVPAEIEAGSVGYGLQFYADLKGPPVPYSYSITSGSEGYDFEQGTEWTSSDYATHASSTDESEGTYAQKITVDVPTVEESCDSATNWSSRGDAGPVTVGTALTEGTGSLYASNISTSSNWAQMCRDNWGPHDFTGKWLSVDLKPVPNAVGSYLTATDGVAFRLSSSTGPGAWSNEMYWFLGTSAQHGNPGLVDDEVTTITFDMDNLPTPDYTDGSPDITNIQRIGFSFARVGAGGTGHILWVDNIRTGSPTAIIQKVNVGGGYDLTATDSMYQIDVKPDYLTSIESARVWFENVAGSGATIPDKRRELTIPVAALTEDAYTTLTIEAVDHDSPAVTAIETIGVEIVRSTGNNDACSILVDNLKVATATNPDYTEAVGDMIETGPDQIKHFIEELCDLGDVVDDTTFDAAITNLGSNIYGGIVSGLGSSFDEILGAWAWEMRAKLITAETSAGTVYKLITSDDAAAYGASSKTLGDWVNLRESRQDFLNLATRFRAFWAWDPFQGFGEDAFTQVSRADADVNDTDVADATFTNAETRMGRRDADPWFLFMVQDEDTANDWLGVMALWAMNDAAARFRLESPAWDSYKLEPGDIVTLQPTWDASGTKTMVLSNDRAPTEPTGELILSEVD